MRTTIHLVCFALAFCSLPLAGCGRNAPCKDYDCLDAYPPGDFGYNDLSYPDFGDWTPDFGHADFGHADFGHADFGHRPDLGPDLAQPDLAHPTPDLARSIQACTSCLSMSCAAQVTACESDAGCIGTLRCVVSDGCFTFAGGSDSFATCVDGCVSAQGLTLSQQVTVLNEIGALSSCTQDCVEVCGGN